MTNSITRYICFLIFYHFEYSINLTLFNYFFTIIFQETSLESFVTPLDDEDTAPDEYQIFRTVVQTLEQGNPGWYVFAKTFLHKINCSFTKYVLYSFCLHYRYGQLTAGLTQDNVKAVQEVFKLCEQRQAAKRSKSIEQAGGKYKKFVKIISFYTES